MSPFNHGESGRKVKLGRDELTVDHNVRKLFLLLNSHANVSSSFIMLTSFHALILPPELAKWFFFFWYFVLFRPVPFSPYLPSPSKNWVKLDRFQSLLFRKRIQETNGKSLFFE